MREVKFRAWNGSMHSNVNIMNGYATVRGVTMVCPSDIIKDAIIMVYEVTYSAPSFDLSGYNNGDYYDGDNPYCHPWREMVIIGNIYENTELLEDK